MAASKELNSLCKRPIYGKQKTIRCGIFDLPLHGSCVQISEKDQVFFTSTKMPSFECAACTQSARSTRDDDTPVKRQRTAPAPDATKKVVSSERQLNLPELRVMRSSVFILK
jgi:hypothetical protein